MAYQAMKPKPTKAGLEEVMACLTSVRYLQEVGKLSKSMTKLLSHFFRVDLTDIRYLIGTLENASACKKCIIQFVSIM